MFLSPRFILHSALSALTFLSVQPAFAMNLRAPHRGEHFSFSRVYSPSELKDHSLQRVKQTTFTLKNTNGLLTGTWDATIRDIRTDEVVKTSATGLCRVRGASRIECAFEADAGTIDLRANAQGLHILIPVGQGVRFLKKSAGDSVGEEILLGTDDDNSRFSLRRKS